MILTEEMLGRFSEHLRYEEKSRATREKYLRDATAFKSFIDNRPLEKRLVLKWKEHLTKKGYAVRSANSMLAAVNSLLDFLNLQECKVKTMRIQHRSYCTETSELTKNDYFQLLKTSGKDERLSLIMQTICSTGIRVSELKYFTLEAVRRGEITVICKGKTRTILVPGKLRQKLIAYARKGKIETGVIFRDRNGNALDRSTIWRQMKRLCKTAGVPKNRVYPHNLRKLFARTFYNAKKDIAKLADVLGHSSIDTTRIYIMTTSAEHLREIERLGLLSTSKEKVT